MFFFIINTSFFRENTIYLDHSLSHMYKLNVKLNVTDPPELFGSRRCSRHSRYVYTIRSIRYFASCIFRGASLDSAAPFDSVSLRLGFEACKMLSPAPLS